LQGAQQFVEYAHATAHRPADGQQAQGQGQGAQAQQLLQGVPDFIDLIPRVDDDGHATAVRQVQYLGTAPRLGKQQAPEPGVQAGRQRRRQGLVGGQPMHAHMAQAGGEMRLQAGRVALGGCAEVMHHRFGRLQLTLHIRQGLMQQQRGAGAGDQGEETAHPQVDAPQCRHT